MKLKLIALSLTLGLASLAQAATITRYYSNTSTIWSGRMEQSTPNGTGPSSNNMDIVNDLGTVRTHHVLAFQVSASAIPVNSVITSVIIRCFNETAVPDSETIEVRRFAGHPGAFNFNQYPPSWNETVENPFLPGTNTWSSYGPDNDDHIADTSGSPVTANVTTINTTYSWDVTADWPSTWAGSTITRHFLMRSSDADAVDLDFTDGIVSSNRPRVEIVYSPPPTATPTNTGTPTRTPTPVPGITATPTPTMHLDEASELGHRLLNRPAISHGPHLFEEGYGFLTDGQTDIQNFTEAYDRNNNFVGNYRNTVRGDFTENITGWVSDAAGELIWNASSAIGEGNSGCLYFNSVASAPVEASRSINVISSNTGRMTYSLSYSTTETVTFGMRVYFDGTSASQLVTATTDENKRWKRAALIFDCTAGVAVTAVEVYLTDFPLWLKIDNLGLFEGGFDQGFVPVVLETLDIDSIEAGSVGGLSPGAIPFADALGALTEDPLNLSYNNSTDVLSVEELSLNIDLDISADTNLSAAAPITLSGDQVGITQSGIDHGTIGGLNDDDHVGYLRLGGRAGSQTGNGGTASGEDLTLDSTAHATKGDVILNPTGGNVGIGTSAPGTLLQIASTVPRIGVYETDAAADNGKFDISTSGESLRWRITDDALSGTFSFLVVERTGTDVDSLTLSAGTSAQANLVIDDAGAVGIGATPGAGQLYVTTGSSLIAKFDAATASLGAIQVENNDGSAYVHADGGDVQVGPNSAFNAANLHISSAGALGVLTGADPTTSFYANGSIGAAVTTVAVDGSTNDDVAIGAFTVVRLTSTDTSPDITSIAGGVDGRFVLLLNVDSADPVQLMDDAGTGTAANRFALNANFTIGTNDAEWIVYDGTSSRWRLANNN